MRWSAVLSSTLLAVACSRATPSTQDQAADGGSFSAVDGSTSSDGGTPLVASLSTSPLALTPAFSPAIHDYYVRCAAGLNAVSVAVTAEAGATVSLLQPVTTVEAASQNASLELAENQAIVVSASSGPATSEYWVRCLPHDFPKLSMVKHPEVGTPLPGYYLVGDTSMALGETSYAMVIDGNGVPVWYSTTSDGSQPVNVESLTSDTLSFVAFFDYTLGEASWKYEVHHLGSDAVSYVEPVGEPLDAHELQLLPNGDYLVLSDPITSGVDLTGLATFGPDESVIGCNVQEVTPSGDVVWQWDADDHFDPVRDCTYPQTVGVGNLTVVDPYHCNSIDVDSSGDLLISSRHMDSVFLVSKASGAVVWKIGGAQYTKDGAAYLYVTDDPQIAFYRQHDARFLGDNQITLFDDATDAPGSARGVVYTYDPGAGEATFVWQYAGAVSSAAMGSFRILADGSRIIGWGEGGTPELVFSEVDASGNDLLDFLFTDGDESYRALKVAVAQLDLGLMRSSAGAVASDDAGAGAADAGGGGDATTITGGPGPGCHAVSGSGAAEQCSYSSAGSCPIAGASPGSCPSAGLYGCCVETLAGDGGGSVVEATCYYASTTGQPAASQCALESYEGMPFDWQTDAP